MLFCIFQPASAPVGDPTGLSLRGFYLAQLTIGVLGVLLATGEYSTGMIRATMCSVPRRLPVLWAKLSVFALVAFATSSAAAFISFLGGQAALSAHHLAGASLSDPAVRDKLSEQEINHIFDAKNYLQNVDAIFKRLGI